MSHVFFELKILQVYSAVLRFWILAKQNLFQEFLSKPNNQTPSESHKSNYCRQVVIGSQVYQKQPE